MGAFSISRQPLPWINLILTAAMISEGALFDVGKTSRNNETPITPSAYAFAIWGLIYLFVVLYAVRECLFEAVDTKPFRAKIQTLFALSSILNITWCAIFTQVSAALSIIPMILLWLSLAIIYNVSCFYIQPKLIIAPSYLKPRYESSSLADIIFIRVTFSMYFSWTTAAMVINFFVSYQALAHPITDWISPLLALAFIVLVNIVAFFTESDIVFASVGTWATAAIAVRARSNGDETLLGAATLSAMLLGAVVVFFTLLSVIRNHRRIYEAIDMGTPKDYGSFNRA